jgi:predicted Zn-dependent protease
MAPKEIPMHTSKIVNGLALGLFSLVLGACATSTAPGAIGADRRQLLLVSSEEINAMSEQAYTQLKNEATAENVLNTDNALVRRVRAIGQRIRPHTGIFRPDAPNWNWELNVLESDQLNAFCMPGGKIMFYSGLIEQLDLSDAEIAIVMGHEVAHALREHSREQMSQALAAQTAIGVGAAIFGLGDAGANIAASGYQALVAPSFSRTDETEADRIGLELTARAGYDPRAGVTLWQKMIAANQGGRPPELLSSHPAEANRIREIEALLPTVMPLYADARN